MTDLARMENALIKADAAGDTEGATILANAIREARAGQQPPPDRSTLKPAQPSTATAVTGQPHIGHKIGAAIDGAAQSLTFGLSDEIAAGLNSGFGLIGDYDQSLTDERARMAENAEKAAGYHLSGGLAGLLVPGKAALKAGNAITKKLGGGLAAKVGAGVATGAATGAVFGFNSGEGGFQSRAKNAAIQGALGAGIGGAVPVAGHYLRKAGHKLASGTRKVLSPSEEAMKRVQNAKRTDDSHGGTLSPEDLKFAKRSEQPVIMADVGGEATRRLARAAGNVSVEGQIALNRPISSRWLNQGDRLTGFLKSLSNDKVDDFAFQEALKNKAREVNRPAYKKAFAYNYGDNFPDGVEEIISKMPAAAMRNAIKIAKTEGRPFGEQIIASIDDVADTVTLSRLPSMRQLHYIQRGLRGEADRAYKTGAGEVGTAYKRLHRELLSRMDEMNPFYREARAGASAFFNAEDALDAGRNFVMQNRGMKETHAALTKMSAPERESFRIGFTGSLIEKIENARDRTNVINQVFGSKGSRQKIKLAIGEERYNQLEVFVRIENAMDATRNAIQGNSTTTQQLRDLGMMAGREAGFAGVVGGAGYFGSGGDPSTAFAIWAASRAARTGANKVSAGIDERLAKRVAQTLSTSSPDSIKMLTKEASKNSKVLEAIKAYELFMSGAAAGVVSQ